MFPQVADFPSFDIKRVCALVTVQLIPDGEMSIAETALITEGFLIELTLRLRRKSRFRCVLSIREQAFISAKDGVDCTQKVRQRN